MAGAVKTYGFINAKLRTRISRILPDEFMNRLIHSHSLGEAVQLFRDTAFSGIETVYNKTGDLKMVELELLKYEINLYVEIEKYVNDQILSFIRILATRYEVDNLKNIIRLWFDKTIRKRDIQDALLYMYREKIHYDLQWDSILPAESLSQVAEILKDTPYAEIIHKNLKYTDEKKSIFSLENGLDVYYYKQLMAGVERLSKQDREIAQRLLGVEIDLKNINLIVRLKNMYNLSLDDALAYLLPYGYAVDKNTLADVYATKDVTGIVKEVVHKRYAGLETLVTSQGTESYSRLILIERVLDQIMLYEVRKVLLGNPFTIGIILAYFILKGNEIKKIVTILNAKYYKISEDRIAGRI
jgi:V/A-type H+/Na+-transporting ATPase subunit C